eukprot:TRINITY_DN306_c1_g1_i3.p1 TRINITY_DN306_c1_g1~~TRINITY_DN306_c1_g1_i3.p1  ORF type:complete len:178 (-),score=21.61 TRINITY_DN306_c1_g1_i3:357-842(-)
MAKKLSFLIVMLILSASILGAEEIGSNGLFMDENSYMMDHPPLLDVDDAHPALHENDIDFDVKQELEASEEEGTNEDVTDASEVQDSDSDYVELTDTAAIARHGGCRRIRRMRSLIGETVTNGRHRNGDCWLIKPAKCKYCEREKNRSRKSERGFFSLQKI